MAMLKNLRVSPVFLSPAMLMKDMTQIIPSPAWLGDKLGMNLAVPAQTATDYNPILWSYGDHFQER